MSRRFFLKGMFFLSSLWASEQSPFFCDVAPKDVRTPEEWQVLQDTLQSLDLVPLLQQIYPVDQGYTTFDDFLIRCSRGIRQILIDPEKGLFPKKCLEKIGEGGDLCIVSYASYNGFYSEFVEANAVALEAVGFNGYYLYSIGDFPSSLDPTVELAGVPYSFKMGMILEAKKLGFNKVLWIDSAAQPLRDPTPLFDQIEKTGAVLFVGSPDNTIWRYIFPQTIQLLQELTGTNVLQQRHIWGAVFGLKLDTPEASSFIESYYQMAKLGFPFLSCFPEQFVCTAIVGQEKYRHWVEKSTDELPNLVYVGLTPQVDALRAMGYYFSIRSH